jgi:hypothetical protein
MHQNITTTYSADVSRKELNECNGFGRKFDIFQLFTARFDIGTETTLS